ncbi:hypothetical protein MPER_00206, partial [Moniliophthora perniciosa FA553]
STDASLNGTIPKVDEPVSQDTVDGHLPQSVSQTSEEVLLNDVAVSSEPTEDVFRLSNDSEEVARGTETPAVEEDSHLPVVDEPYSETITPSYPPAT